MKYGESLGVYSVPEWRSHNILYDELKHEIKDLTVTPAAFSKSSYQALIDSFKEELSSVNSFVHCKTSETEYRFQQCDQLVKESAKSSDDLRKAETTDEDVQDDADDEGTDNENANGSPKLSSKKHTKRSSKRSTKNTLNGTSHDSISKQTIPDITISSTSPKNDSNSSLDEGKVRELKREVSKSTQEIQNLSRFIGAQFTGFRKLIKKYRRHAPPEQIDQGRDLAEIEESLVSKDSFAEVDLTPQFLELSLSYSAIRTNRYHDFIKQPVKGTSMVDQMSNYDVEMSTVPVSDLYRFWVHADNLMQLKVLLVQHMDLLAPPELQEGLTHQHQQHSGTTALHASPPHQLEEHSSATYMDTEDLQSARNSKEPAQIRQITLGKEHSQPFLLVPMGGMRHPAVMKLSDKQVTALQKGNYEELSAENGSEHQSSTPTNSTTKSNAESVNSTPSQIDVTGSGSNPKRHSAASTSSTTSNIKQRAAASVGAQSALGWVSSHRAKPVINSSMKRTRFKSAEDHIWAAIETNVSIDMPVEDGNKITFPYGVLEIRTRSSNRPAWIDTLLHSHLVYPISSTFSSYGWALVTTRPQQVLVRPSWSDVLDSGAEIRREPSKAVLPMKAQKSVTNLKLMGGRSPNRRSSRGDDRLISNGASLNEHEQEEQPQQVQRTRYWNEFDDGEDFQESSQHFFDEIDEELRRAKVASRLAMPVYRIGEGMRRHLSTSFDRQNSLEPESNENPSLRSVESDYSSSSEQPTRSGQYSPRVGPSRRGSTESSTTTNSRSQSAMLSNYGACESQDGVQNEIMRRRNDRGLALITFSCFVLSIFIVGLVFVILFTEDISESPSGSRAALILFSSVALCLALLGYVAYNFRSDADWVSQMVVHSASLTVVCFGVGGVANIAVPPV